MPNRNPRQMDVDVDVVFDTHNVSKELGNRLISNQNEIQVI